MFAFPLQPKYYNNAGNALLPLLLLKFLNIPDTKTLRVVDNHNKVSGKSNEGKNERISESQKIFIPKILINLLRS